MISRRGLVIGAGLLGIGCAAFGTAFAKADDLGLPPPLDKLRALALTLPDGTPTTLGDHLTAGRAVVVSLWATWCGPCSTEASHLTELRVTELRGKIAADRLDIIGINIDAKRDEAKIAQFLKRSKVSFTQLRGESEATYLAFGGHLPVTLPRLYVFNTTGAPTFVSGRYNGGTTLKAIDAQITAAMKA